MPSQQGAELSAAITEVDWTDVCRRSVAAMEEIFSANGTIEERTEYEGVGEGGDRALVIDRRSEDAVFAELERVAADGHSFVAISEERGELTFGDGGEVRVVIDPIDGSMNARRTIPSFALSFAVADGPSMEDVGFGFIHDFGTGEEFVAVRGGGARQDGRPITVPASDPVLEVVGIEAAKPSLAAPVAEALKEDVYRLRGIGAIAINLAWVANGRLDGMISLRPCRSVDCAAGQLIVREAGGQVEIGDGSLAEAGLGLDERLGLIAATTPDGLALLRHAQRHAL